MQPTLRRLATAAAGRDALKPAMALLPPIPLYRRLFRAHRRHLPTEMRVLGDEYIKKEFHAHKTTDNPVHIVCYSPPSTSTIYIIRLGIS